MKDYMEAKYGLLQHSTKGILTTQGVLDSLTELSIPMTHSAPLALYTNEYPLENTQFVGAHNAGNLQVCYLLVKKLLDEHGILIEDETIRSTISTIQPLAHRIQLVNEKSGIKFYDDSKATSSQALKVALEAFPGPIALIAGWSDKGDNFSALSELMKQKVGYGAFIGTTSPQFVQIAETKAIPHMQTNSMEEAVKLTYEYAKNNNIQVILLSPGCASFDMFKDYQDRAHHFIDAVNWL